MDFSGVRLRDYHAWPYEQIAAVIEEAVTSGELLPGQRVPPEKEIMDLTGASRWTVRHAVALLREKGLVRTVPHMGSFVTGGPPPAAS
jgi:GntR family transcriptional regulator